ncbi:MAG: CHAT domain-containing tetratricopeptide repeat protein [Bacteroidota bacterium]
MTVNASKFFCFCAILVLISSSSAISAGDRKKLAEADSLIRQADRCFQRLEYDSALFSYRSASNLIQQEKSLSYLQSQIGISNILLRKGDFENAIILLQNAESIVLEKQYSQSAEAGTIDMLLGFCFLVNERFDTAETYCTRGLATLIANYGEQSEKTASAYYTCGAVQKAKGNYDAGISYFERALAIQQSLQYISKLSIGNTLLFLGMIHDDKNKFDDAIHYYHKADSLFALVGSSGTMSAASCNLNTMSSYNNKGDYRNALVYGKKALAILESANLQEHANMASTLSKLGEVYANLGDYNNAVEYFSRALTIFSTKYPQKKSAIGAVYQRLGDIYWKIGEKQKAIQQCELGMRLYEEAYGEYHPQAGFMYEVLAGVYSNAGRYDDAVRFYHKALVARQRVTDVAARNDIAMLHVSLAHAWLQKHQRDSAFAELQRAASIENTSSEKNILLLGLLQQQYGDYYEQQGNYSRALLSYNIALKTLSQDDRYDGEQRIPSFEGSVNKKELLSVLLNKAGVLEKISRNKKDHSALQASLAHYQSAMDLLDDIRKHLSSDASKFYVAETGSQIYRNGCRVALVLYKKTKDRGYLEQAFLASDRSKGNALMERLFDNEAKAIGGIPDSLLAYEQDLLNIEAKSESRMARLVNGKEKREDPEFAKIHAEYFSARQRHQDLVGLLEQSYPKYFGLKYGRYTLSLPQLQQKLDPNTVIAEYMIDNDSIYLFAVTKNSLSVKILRNTARIKELTKQFSASLKTYDTEMFFRTGYDLYNSVLQPIAAVIGRSSDLRIIPDGFLYHIPFESLPTMSYNGSAFDFSTASYVISNHEVTYSYSTAFDLKLNAGTDRKSAGPQSFIGFAPVFKDTGKNSDFFANRSFAERSGMSDVRSITLDGKTFNELKYSDEEITSIGTTFRQHALSAASYLNEEATEENFKTYAPLYDIVHVATHGFINEKDPKHSAVIFSQPGPTTAGEDGILHLHETFNLNLKAKLVVLSSCESGIGTLVDGEGMMALSRGLFYAGAKNIIVSLWKVSDRQTYVLMDEFYKNLASGSTYAASLRAAKLSMIRSKDSAFPGKWSGFVLIGQ